MENNKIFDVIIIGGSYAGLSAAMALGRSLRKTLVIDSGKPCNRQTPHSHNFLTQDGSTPKDIFTLARHQVEQYKSIQFLDTLAIKGNKVEEGFEVTVSNGETYTGKKLILATGIKDEVPEVKGFSECWGISVIHCPYCHGYEFRNQTTGIMANGERAFHLASLVNNLTTNLTILTRGKADFSSEQLTKLNKHSIRIIETPVAEITHENGHIRTIVFEDNTSKKFDAVYASVPFVQHSDIPASLGCEFTDHGYIKIDPFYKTSIPGVFACGDNSNFMRSVAHAVYSGNMVGAMANKELTDDLF